MLGVKYFLIIIIFVLGIILGYSINQNLAYLQTYSAPEADNSLYNENPDFAIYSSMPVKKSSPSDRIKENNIKIYKNEIRISVNNPILARFTDTKSMEPVINKDTNAIEIVPSSINEIDVGDIISYKSAFSDGIIIHRVIEKGSDECGLYVRTKGDNLNYTDPEKIRFEQIRRVVVGILY